jgi:hypothetical protein
MLARRVTVDDVPWAVDRLSQRRAKLASFAPVYWRPASDAVPRHHDFLTYLLSDDGAVGSRTDSELMIASRGGQGWVIDDAAVQDTAWANESDEPGAWTEPRQVRSYEQ